MASPSSSTTTADIARAIFSDIFTTIIHKTILDQHRAHKSLLATLDPTTKLPPCDKCGLPRLLDPPLAPKVRGAAASDPPKDTAYCDRKPWCRAPGFDIYGNPFPRADVTGRPPTKKERAEAAKNKKGEGNDTPDDGTAPPSPSADGDGEAGGGPPRKLEKGEKKASKIDEKLKKGEYVPWQTCPSCKRSLLVTRFAKHLEQCMGLSGRAASRNAMAKMNGSGSGTPGGSRGGTPGAENGTAGGNEEGEEEDGERIKGPGAVRKKVLKKVVKDKLKNSSASANNSNNKAPPTSSNGGGGGKLHLKATPAKRDRDGGGEDEDADNVHVKKRQKLQRVESAASLGSGGSGSLLDADADGDRESVDESFVDFGGGEGEDGEADD